MKTMFCFAALCLLLAAGNAAATAPPAGSSTTLLSWHSASPTSPNNDPDEELLTSRTVQVTNYLTAALRLTRGQADSVRAHTRRHLQLHTHTATPGQAALPQLPALGSAGQLQSYHQALQAILTAEQYQRLEALEARQNHQPVMVLVARLK